MTTNETKLEEQENQQLNEETATEPRRNKKKKKKNAWFWKRTRLIPIWFRILLSLVLILLAAVAGAMVGYTLIGDGTNPMEVLNPDTWIHIFDIIYGG